MTTFDPYFTGNITLNRETDIIQRKGSAHDDPKQILTGGLGGQIGSTLTSSVSNI